MGRAGWKSMLFTKKERLGIYGLFMLLICMQFVLWIYREHETPVSVRTVEIENSTDSNQAHSNFGHKKSNNHHKLTLSYKRNVISKVRFNPNEASDEVWFDLGVRPGKVKTIRRYLEKGGRFRRGSDLFRIWGMDSVKAETMQAYVDIPAERIDNGSIKKQRIEKKPLLVDLNASDSADWESLPGIGPVMASRIVRYRKRLGGFVSVEQLREVYGVSDTLMSMLGKQLLHGERVMRRDLMLATEEELKSHPYIGYKMARLIVRYREQHPEVNQWEVWKQIPGVTDSVLARWKPYFRM
jgi:competence protein ComEA